MSEKSVKNTFLMEGLQDFNENQNMCGRDLYTLKPCSESERWPAGHIFYTMVNSAPCEGNDINIMNFSKCQREDYCYFSEPPDTKQALRWNWNRAKALFGNEYLVRMIKWGEDFCKLSFYNYKTCVNTNLWHSNRWPNMKVKIFWVIVVAKLYLCLFQIYVGSVSTTLGAGDNNSGRPRWFSFLHFSNIWFCANIVVSGLPFYL